MATRFLKLRGKSGWMKVHKDYPDEYNGQKFWSVDLYLEGDQLEKYKNSGLKLRAIGKERKGTPLFDDPFVGYKFRRPLRKLIKDEIVEFKPVKITNIYDEPITDSVGIGSVIEITVAVYDIPGMQNPGHRLENIKVLELIPYEKKEKNQDEENNEGLGIKTKVSPKVKTPW